MPASCGALGPSCSPRQTAWPTSPCGAQLKTNAGTKTRRCTSCALAKHLGRLRERLTKLESGHSQGGFTVDTTARRYASWALQSTPIESIDEPLKRVVVAEMRAAVRCFSPAPLAAVRQLRQASLPRQRPDGDCPDQLLRSLFVAGAVRSVTSGPLHPGGPAQRASSLVTQNTQLA